MPNVTISETLVNYIKGIKGDWCKAGKGFEMPDWKEYVAFAYLKKIVKNEKLFFDYYTQGEEESIECVQK